MPWRKGIRLHTVAEKDADPATRRLYDEIKSALLLPGLQLYFTALGVYPRFLGLFWETIRNVASSPELRAAGERLRADAYTRAHNYFRVPDLRRYADPARSLDGAPSLLAVADFFHYRDPLTLLLFTFQIQAMEGPAGKPVDGTADACASVQPTPILLEVPPSISEHTASAPMKRKFEEMRRALATPFVSPDLCAFAMRADFLDPYWAAVKQMLSSPLYPECKHGLRSSAWALASQLPGPVELTQDQMAEAALTPEEVTSVARILDLFVDYLSGALLNVAAAKIALEGGNLVASEHSSKADDRTQPAA